MSGIADLLGGVEGYDSIKIPGVVQGIVVENNNDKFKGMVKVEFTVWEQGQNLCEWVRLMAPYTGKGYGSYMVPEINEIVLVGFIGGSIKRPFLIGSLYPSGDSMVNDQYDKNNYNKTLTTKGGNHIAISDEKGKQSITITTPKGSVITISDEKETCTIADKNGKNALQLDYKKGEVSITAEKKINLKAGSVTLAMDGTAGKFEVSAGNVKLAAKQAAEMTGNTQLNLKGAQATIEGSAKLTAKGGAMAEISGGMVKIN